MNSRQKQHNTVTTKHTTVCAVNTHTHTYVESCSVEVISCVSSVMNDISKLIPKTTCQRETTDDYTTSLNFETEDRAIEGIYLNYMDC